MPNLSQMLLKLLAAGVLGSLSAAAVAATVGGVPQVSLSASQLTFAQTKVGTMSAAQTVTVKNTGTAPLNVRSLSAEALIAKQYVLASRCPSLLAVGATCPFTITYKPTTAGQHVGRVTLSTNALNGLVSGVVSVSGSTPPVSTAIGTKLPTPAPTTSNTTTNYSGTAIGAALGGTTGAPPAGSTTTTSGGTTIGTTMGVGATAPAPAGTTNYAGTAIGTTLGGTTGAAPAPAPAVPTTEVPYVSMNATLGGKSREFLYVAPKGTPKGLIILLHGLGLDAYDYLKAPSSAYVIRYRDAGYAFAILRGSNVAPREDQAAGTVLRGWGDPSGGCCSTLYTQAANFKLKQAGLPLKTAPAVENDVGAVSDLAVQGSRALGLPTSKVILLGMSNGGILAYRAQCTLPAGTFGAVVSIAGSWTGATACGSGASTKFAHIHGDKDTVVPYVGGLTSIAPLYPEYYFPRSVKGSFNVVAQAAGCTFGANAEGASITAGPATTNLLSLMAEGAAVDYPWELATAKCPSGKIFTLATMKGGTHGLSEYTFKLGLHFATAAIGN